MANDVKSGIGYIIPAAGVVGFFVALALEESLMSIIIAVAGILIWFLYMLVMESHIPQQMGNMIILFGVLLSLGIFVGFGINQHLHGGYILNPEGSIFSLVILFFSVLTGLNFRNQQNSLITKRVNGSDARLSESDRELVMDAINKSQEKSNSHTKEPQVIVVKQEKTSEQEKQEQLTQSPNPYDPYLMSNNPYFSYPPDYYYDDDDDDEYDDEWDDYEDDED